MGMSRCFSLMKCLLVLFNIIFLCVGSGACGFAAWALWEGGAGESSAGRAGLCALAAWGGGLALAALLALGGVARGSGALLAAAAALLGLTAAAAAAAAWWGAAHLPQLRAALLQRLDRTVRHDYGVLPARTHLVDAIQQGLECCGANDPRDWQSSAWARAQAVGVEEGEAGEGVESGAGAGAAATGALDLSVSAPAQYYWVPPSCCVAGEAGCARGRRVGVLARGGAGAGLHDAACGRRVLAALAEGARAPLLAAAAALAAHVAATLLALALALRAKPHHRYKA